MTFTFIPKNFLLGVLMANLIYKKSKIFKSLSFILVLQGLVSSVSFANTQPTDKVKNVIVMIPDGMSVGATTLARLYQDTYSQDAEANYGYGNETLFMTSLMTGTVTTHDAAGQITDSAAAGTALATSWKTKSGVVGMTGDVGSDYSKYAINPKEAQLTTHMPLATILEAARLKNKATGIVSTSEFMHATPAAFTSHDLSRSSYDNLAEQIIHNKLDVVLGGGRVYINDPSTRKDGENLKDMASDAGFTTIVQSTDDLMKFNGNKLLGVFGADQKAQFMSNHIDRDPQVEPSLAQMTDKAIEILNKDNDGFFLMVEGSKVDWAAHGNDPVALVSEIRGFDEAVKAAYDFAKADGNTLLILVTDHGNAGLSIADRSISSGYDKTKWTTFIEPIKNAKVTVEGAVNLFNSSGKTQNDLNTILKDKMGLVDLTPAEAEAAYTALTQTNPDTKVIAKLISTRAKIGFGYDSHTAEEVVLYTYDPRGVYLSGLIDNTDIPKFIATSTGLDLVSTTQSLFVNATDYFSSKGVSVTLNNPNTNPALTLTYNGKSIEIPQNKNYVLIDGVRTEHPSLNVFQKGKWFISQAAITEIEK